jgi:membrane associated rhomboid family serine protease
MFPLYDDNPTSRRPYVTIALMAGCILAFFWQLSLGQRAGQLAVYSLGFIPAVFFGAAELPNELVLVPPSATIVTSMFLHGGVMHLVGNMLYLWIGASGAISGVLGAYLLLFPHARVYVLIPFGFLFVHPVPAGLLLVIWFIFQLLSGAMAADVAGGGVAFWAHVGGFVAGMGLIWVFRDKDFIARRRKVRARSRIPPTWARGRRGPWS